MLKKLLSRYPLFLSLSAICVPNILAADSSTEQAIQKSNETGLAIIQSMSREGANNIAISPVSINAVFGALQKGAANKTLDNIKQTLGDTASFQNFCREYTSSSEETSIANLLVVDNSLELKPDFKKSIPEEELRSADFKANPAEECKNINLWVEQQTKGEIKDLLSPNAIDDKTVMIALNAIAFEGKWTIPFDEEKTEAGTFNIQDGSSVNVNMMKRTEETVFTLDEDGCTIVSLPYASSDKDKTSELSFVIVMPCKDQTLQELIATLNKDQLLQMIPSLDHETMKATLIMPRFELKTDTVSLVKPLKQMGLTSIFDYNEADFSNMTTEQNIAVKDVLHQCYIKVDEKGTKAAAATAVLIERMALPPTIEVNRPFMWLIYDHANKLILFCGTVNNPAS